MRRLLFLSLITVALALGSGVLPRPLTMTVSADPNHFAGDYVIFAKALNPVDPNRETNEPSCDTSNHGQAESSGQNNTFWGRIHSNADLKLSGANTYRGTSSPDTEITYGVNEPNQAPPEECQLQNDAGNTLLGGSPTNITGSGNAADVQGPYQIGPNGWPGNLGTFLNANETFTDTTSTSAVGLTCQAGTSLTGTTKIEITASNFTTYANKVVCNGSAEVVVKDALGSAATPFRVTVLSHGLISFEGQGSFYAPATSGHGILAWTDLSWATAKPAIKISGSNINIPERAILFATRNSIDVSGSDDDDQCIQAIGQGIVKIAGSTSDFGPLAPACGAPANVQTEIHANLNANPHFNLGAGASAVEAGTPVHDKVIVSSTTTPVSNLTGTITAQRFSNGTCTNTAAATAVYKTSPGVGELPYTAGPVVTLEDVLPFTPAAGIYSYLASYGGDSNKNLANGGACEGPLRVVDARITINPPTGVNAVGTPHPLTGHVDINDGTGFVNAPNGTTINFAVVTGTGALSAASCQTTGGTGSCSVNLSNTSAGVDTVSASTTVTVSGVSLVRSTNGTAGPGGSGNATKTWVDLRISLDPLTATNTVNEPHTVTAKVEKNEGLGAGWVVVNGATVNFALLNNDAGAAFVGNDSDCVTGAAGTCVISINTSTPGSVDIQGTTTVSVSGQSITRTTGTAPNTTAGGTGNANKLYVDLRISLDPLEATNAVGEPHQITALVEQDAGNGWEPVETATVDFALLNNTANAAFVSNDDDCVTDANGECSISINTSTPGSVDIEGTAIVVVSGESITRTTGTQANTDAGGSANANKVYVDLRISLSPLTASNPLNDPHEITALVEKNEGLGADWELVSGATVDFAFVTNDIGAFFVGGVDSCLTGVDGTCVVTINSASPGTVTVSGETTVVVSGETITRITGDDANTTAGGSGNASKTYFGGTTWLIIDEDSIENGMRFVEDPTIGVQNIFPSTTRVFSDTEVNDDDAAIGLRAVLEYFAANVGNTISVLTGQTGEEAWFAPNCVPFSWIGAAGGCTEKDSPEFLQGIANFFNATVQQELLDEIPDVRPLRALGLTEKIGETICAVVYDNDISSVNYLDNPPYLTASLQGETLGIVAFTVLDVVKLEDFDSSSLPEAQILIVNPATACPPARVNDAPIPQSSSVPADIDPANPPATGYRNRP